MTVLTSQRSGSGFRAAIGGGFPITLLFLGLLFWISSWTASKDLPAVADEVAHITGGESYWRYGINHLQPENGYMAMHWATLPLRFSPPVFPPVPNDIPQGSAMIVIGNRMFYESGNDPATMLARGRAMMALVGTALVILIGWWGRQLWGPEGGVLAAALAAFCPTLLAHSGLVMSDVTLSFFLLLTVTLWWRLLNRLTLLAVAGCGISLGALLLSKMSGVLVAPMLLVLSLVRGLESAPLNCEIANSATAVTGGRKIALIGVAAVSVALVASLVLWAAFGFHFSMFANPAAPMPQLDITWEALLNNGGFTGQTIGWLRDRQLLPEAWLRGLAQTIFTLSGRYSFLNGVTTLGGTFWYFPYAWLVKTPPPLFALIALGLAAPFIGNDSARPPSPRGTAPFCGFLRESAPLWVLFVIYWGFALTTAINIGHRHLLPVYAPMLIVAGGAAKFLRHGPLAGRLLVIGSAVWFAACSAWIRPHYLAYFNSIAGGPANGYRHLVDSNVDVGQDLLRLKKWLEESGAAVSGPNRVFLSYFGPADPVAHGLRATRFGDIGFDARPRVFPARVQGGLFCISVTLFQGLYALTGPWSDEREKDYQRLLGVATAGQPTANEASFLEHLQFARLRHVLAAREPDHRIGYSILVFRLSDAEVAEALYAPWDQLRRKVPDRVLMH